jgi:hypothetical protein
VDATQRLSRALQTTPATAKDEAMRDCLKFYIDGAWVDPVATGVHEVVDPATDCVNVLLAVVSAVPTGIAALLDAVILGALSRLSVGPTVQVTS